MTVKRGAQYLFPLAFLLLDAAMARRRDHAKSPRISETKQDKKRSWLRSGRDGFGSRVDSDTTNAICMRPCAPETFLSLFLFFFAKNNAAGQCNVQRVQAAASRVGQLLEALQIFARNTNEAQCTLLLLWRKHLFFFWRIRFMDSQICCSGALKAHERGIYFYLRSGFPKFCVFFLFFNSRSVPRAYYCYCYCCEWPFKQFKRHAPYNRAGFSPVQLLASAHVRRRDPMDLHALEFLLRDASLFETSSSLRFI